MLKLSRKFSRKLSPGMEEINFPRGISTLKDGLYCTQLATLGGPKLFKYLYKTTRSTFMLQIAMDGMR